MELSQQISPSCIDYDRLMEDFGDGVTITALRIHLLRLRRKFEAGKTPPSSPPHIQKGKVSKCRPHRELTNPTAAPSPEKKRKIIELKDESEADDLKFESE